MSTEYKAFIQQFHSLHTGIREGLDPLAQEAFARSLINEGVHHGANDISFSIDTRTTKFLNGIKDRIHLDSSAFDLFVDLLESQTGMEYLATRLRKSKSSPTLESSRDCEPILRSGPTFTRRCHSPPPIFGNFTDRFSHDFSLKFTGERKEDRLQVTETKQELVSPPPKAAQTVISTLNEKLVGTPDILPLNETPTIGRNNNPPHSLKSLRSRSVERTSELTPVQAGYPKLMQTIPTPTTSLPAYCSNAAKASSKPCEDVDQATPIEVEVKTTEKEETLELPTDNLRPCFAISSSVESSLEYFTPMSTPPVCDSQPPDFAPVQESHHTCGSAIPHTQTEATPSPPAVCPHYQQSLELSVKVESLERDLQQCYRREQEHFESHNSELQQIIQENFALKQHNDNLQQHVEYRVAQIKERDRKLSEQGFTIYDLKRELETHQAKAKGFDYVVKCEKLESQLQSALDRLSVVEQRSYSNGNAYGQVGYHHNDHDP